MSTKTLSQALAEVQSLTASLNTANEQIAAHAGVVTALTTERDTAVSAAAEAKNKLAEIEPKLATAQSEVTRLTTENTALAAKEQDIATRAGALATQRMSAIGQPPVPASHVPDPGKQQAKDLPPRARLEAAIKSSLAKKTSL